MMVVGRVVGSILWTLCFDIAAGDGLRQCSLKEVSIFDDLGGQAQPSGE